MTNAEIISFWITVFIYVFCFCLQLFGFVTRKNKGMIWSIKLLWVGLFFNTLTGIIRWIAGGHPPVTDVYELNVTGAWFLIFLFLIFEKIKKVEKPMGLVAIPVAFLVMGLGFVAHAEPVPMGPAYQSPWLVVHVIFAWLGFGCYAVATGAAALVLLQNKNSSWKSSLKIPEPERLDLTSYRFVILGFINHGIMIVSGAIWAKNLWGQYWSWDPLETWSLIAFLYYAFYLHARSFLGWKMRRAAWLTILGLIILAVSFWGVKWISPSVHPGV